MRTLLVLFLLANLAVCLGVARCPFYTRSQKFIQAALVWLLPLLGAVGGGVFLWTQYAQARRSDRAHAASEDWQNSVDTIHHGD